MKHCGNCGGGGAHCDVCYRSSLICECFKAECGIPCRDCDGSGLVKGGQGRSAHEIQMAAENMVTLFVLLIVFIIAALVMF